MYIHTGITYRTIKIRTYKYMHHAHQVRLPPLHGRPVPRRAAPGDRTRDPAYQPGQRRAAAEVPWRCRFADVSFYGPTTAGCVCVLRVCVRLCG
jgi:hypothetical protein